MGRLQVYLHGSWNYVFCRNPQFADPITTGDQRKALSGQALGYFKSCYANHEFRVV